MSGTIKAGHLTGICRLGYYRDSDKVVGYEFIWFTDGIWLISARNNLRETFDSMDNIYNIHDMKNGIMKEIFK